MRIILLLLVLTLVPTAANYILGSNELALTTYALEAEHGSRVHPMVVDWDASASGGAYIYSDTNNQGVATFTVDLANSGAYVIWCRVLAPDSSNDSFYVSADGGPEDIYDVTPNSWSDAWQWARVNGRSSQGSLLSPSPLIFQLSAGTHQIVFRAREMHTKLDSFVVTNDLDFVPEEPVITSTPTPDPAWTNCSWEGGQCSFTGTRQVRYGANGAYAYGTFTGGVLCSNSVFGDPAYGVGKACDYSTQTAQPTPTPTPTSTPAWTNCAREGGQCSFTGTRQVRYGANGAYAYGTFTGGVLCSNSVFGDPAYGVGKACDYSTQTAQPTPTPSPTPTPTPTPSPTPSPTPTPPPPPAAPPATGGLFYASPDGRSTGNGSLSAPWDLTTAMNHPAAVKPGDTIYLRGGTYRLDTSPEPDTSYWGVTGTAAAPITVRPAPGERAIIDLDYNLQVHGAHARYVGLEFITSRTKKVFSTGWAPDRPGSVDLTGDNLKIINCIFHDLSFITAFAAAQNLEMHGNIMYYIGFIAPDRSWGTTAYIQNESGRKDVTDNIMFQQFSHNIQVYGSDAATARDVYMEGNTIFNSGTLGTSRGFNTVVWVGQRAVERIGFSDNYLYSPFFDSSNAVFWGAADTVNYDLTVNSNYIIGGAPPLRLGVWNPVKLTNNTIYGGDWLVWYEGALPQPRQYNWDNNKYYYQGGAQQFILSSQHHSFAGWKQATGLDSGSTATTARPTGMKVAVRPNRYEPGRAHITVVNWDLANTASVDLSGAGLAVGRQFEIRDAQNYFGPPLVTGTYQGSPVTVPLPGTGSPVSPVIGADDPRNVGLVLPVHTPKEFNSFVLLPR